MANESPQKWYLTLAFYNKRGKLTASQQIESQDIKQLEGFVKQVSQQMLGDKSGDVLRTSLSTKPMNPAKIMGKKWNSLLSKKKLVAPKPITPFTRFNRRRPF